MKVKFYRSPDEEPGGEMETPVSTESTSKKEDEILSQVAPEVEEVKVFEAGKTDFKSIEELEAEEVKESSEEKKDEEKKIETPVSKKEESKSTETDDEESVFKIKDIPVADPEEESNWITVGKELGFDLKEDSFDELKEAFNKKLSDLPLVAEEEILTKKVEALDPKAKDLFEFLQNDGKLDDYINPVKQYDEIISLDDEAIVRKNLELNNWDADKIDEQVAIFKEDGKLETTAYSLRKTVETAREAFKTNLFAQQQNLATATAQKAANDKINQVNQFRERLNKVESYQGFALDKESKDAIVKKYEAGFYSKAKDDPDFAVDMYLKYELAESLIAKSKNKGYAEGVNKNQDLLHNVKRTNSQEVSSRSAKNIASPAKEGDFASWKVSLDEG